MYVDIVVTSVTMCGSIYIYVYALLVFLSLVALPSFWLIYPIYQGGVRTSNIDLIDIKRLYMMFDSKEIGYFPVVRADGRNG